MAYKKPAYDLKTTGVYKFKTKDKEYILKVTYFERESDTQDSLAIQDDLRGELGSINIKNASWNKLSKGETIRAVSSKGDTGMLTRIDDIKSFDKYADGGGVGIDNFFVKSNFGHWSIIDRKTNKMVVGYSKKEDATITAKGLNDVSDASELNKIISKLKSMDGYGYFLNTMAHGGGVDNGNKVTIDKIEKIVSSKNGNYLTISQYDEVKRLMLSNKYDLFNNEENWKNLPSNLTELIEDSEMYYGFEENEIKKFLKKVNSLGYTFNYVDVATKNNGEFSHTFKPYALRKIEYAKGGGVGGGIGEIEYKIGDIFEGNPKATYEENWQLFKPLKSYVIDNKTNKIVSIHKTPYEAIEKRNSLDKNFKLHYEVKPKEFYNKMAHGGSMGSNNKNGKYLDSISSDKKSKILKNIASHYGFSVGDAEEEVRDADAEMLYEYIANDQSLRMDVYNDMKRDMMAKGGGINKQVYTYTDKNLEGRYATRFIRSAGENGLSKYVERLSNTKVKITVPSDKKESEELLEIVEFSIGRNNLVPFHSHGGSIEDENREMVLNENNQIIHHTKELPTAIKGKRVPAWVVTKVHESASDLSDATHYMDGQKMAKGGNVKYVDTKFSQNNSGVPYFLEFKDAVGSFAWKYGKYNEGILYNLSDFDKDYYSHLPLKMGEKLFRYSTDIMIGDSKYLIKINLDKGLIYFMSEENDKNDDKNISFETKGIKSEYITLDKDKFSKGGKVGKSGYAIMQKGELRTDAYSRVEFFDTTEKALFKMSHVPLFKSLTKEEKLKLIVPYTYTKENKYAKGGLLVGTKVKVSFRKEIGVVKDYDNDWATVYYPDLGFSEKVNLKSENVTIVGEMEKGGGVSEDNKFNYMMLGRLQTDCDYYLGNGNRSEKVLWAGNVDDHIEEMKKIWNNLPKDGKPEWLSMGDIKNYENKMKNNKMEKDNNKFYALTSDGMKNKRKQIIKSVSFWKERVNKHTPTLENIKDFLEQVPFDETIAIYSYDDSSFYGELHSAYTPLYTNGAKSVDAIIDSNNKIVWNKYEGSKYVLNVSDYKMENGGSKMANGGGVWRDFYEGQSIILQQETSTKLDKSVKNIFNKFSNKELVIDKIESNTPYNIAKVFDRNTGEKAPFDVILNPKYVEQYAKGGNIYSETMKTADGDIVGEVRYNDHYKTFQVVIDGVTYEEFKSKAEAIENLKNAGFGKMAKGGSISDIGFENSNLYLYGFGIDNNGNSIVKVGFPNQRAFSIQTNGVLRNTHNLNRTKLSELSSGDIASIENEVVDYVKNYGSITQKKSLKIYGSKMAKGGGLGDTIADRYARLTKTEGKRLDELSKKVRINEQTEAEDVEWDKLVHKYRGWDYANKMAKGGGVTDYGVNYNIVFEKPDSDMAWKETINASSEKEARAEFKKKHPTCTILNISEAYANGGSMDSQQGIDLFEDYENIPANVQSVLDNHEDAFMDGDYKELQKALTQLKKVGYTFEFDLDGQAYDLRPIGTKGKSEMEDDEEGTEAFKQGGNVESSVTKLNKLGIRTSNEFGDEFRDFLDRLEENNDGEYIGYRLDLPNNELTLIQEKATKTVSILDYSEFPKNGTWRIEKHSIIHYKEGGSINAKSIFKEYEENENDNYHAENILLLANNFGTEEDVETAKEILKQRDKQGSTSEAMNKKSYELNKRLYPKLIDALNSNKNQTTMTQEHIDKFVRGANSTDETAREISTRKLKEAGLDKNGKPLESKKEVAKSKIPSKKQTSVKSTPQKEDDYDCDEIIAEALKRKKNAKKSAEKSANKPEVVKATKKVERTHDAIEKQIEAGKLKKAQIEKIIAETEDLLKMLKKALKSL